MSWCPPSQAGSGHVTLPGASHPISFPGLVLKEAPQAERLARDDLQPSPSPEVGLARVPGTSLTPHWFLVSSLILWSHLLAMCRHSVAICNVPTQEPCSQVTNVSAKQTNKAKTQPPHRPHHILSKFTFWCWAKFVRSIGLRPGHSCR